MYLAIVSAMLLVLVGLGIYLGRLVLRDYYSRFKQELDGREQYYAGLVNEEKRIQGQKSQLDSKAESIIALYEITREISRAQDEKGLMAIFIEQVKQHFVFQDCRLLESTVDIQELEDRFILPLYSEKRIIGYLAVGGLDQNEKDSFAIVAGQLALGLKRVRLYQEIERLAITDSVSSLFSRRYCLERFGKEFSRSLNHKSHISFLMIDLDHFKSYNDTYGHPVGDAILKEVGFIIKDTIREIDFAGRYGGEEFCVVLPDTPKEGAAFVAERVRQAIASTRIKAYEEVLNLTASIGLATSPEDASDYQELIDKSDWALYRAKKLGRNRVCTFGIYK